MSTTLTGARYIVKFLEARGVRTVTGIPGGSILPLYDALAESARVRHVLARHEQGAAFMAQGMARLTGRPGVCLATSGPGATNLVTAIADARRDSVPLVCLTGQVPRALLGTEAFQEVDIVAVTRPLTKSSRMVADARELPEALAEAFDLAASGRPGPVLVDIPRDVQAQAMGEEFPAPGPGTLAAPPAPQAWDVARAAAMLGAAKRPVLLLGGGAVRGEAPALARALAEKAGLPVTMTLMGLGALPAGHPLSLGMHGMHGHAQANHALHRCDLLLAVGSRFDDRATGDPATFCPNAKVIHVNLDPAELGRIRRADLGFVCDAGRFLAALLPLAERRERRAWLAEVAALKAAGYGREAARAHKEIAEGSEGCGRNTAGARMENSEDVSKPGGAIGCGRKAGCSAGETVEVALNDAGPACARGVIAEVAALLPGNAVVVTDVGQHQMFAAQSFPFRAPGRWLTSGGLGVMGFGLPAAIGAALAEPGTTVALFTGDGSLKMNVQELATLAETGADVKVIVLDNQGLGLVAQQQRLFFGGRKSASRYERGTGFAALAQAFGVPGLDLDAAPDRARALARALAAPGPALVHARVDRRAMVFPMVAPGGSNTDMLRGHPEDSGAALPEAANMG